MRRNQGTVARLFLLTALTMAAFAANSLLNRAALSDGDTGAAAFAAIRLISGALCLAGLLAIRGGLPRLWTPGRWIGTASLAAYMLGFSFAYLALDAGVGALILFGMVQVTMFGGGLLAGEKPPVNRWLGAVLALAGLAWLVWPGAVDAPDIRAAVLMAGAAIGWGIYSLAGRHAVDPLKNTAANFICAAPLALLVWILVPGSITPNGIVLAVVSGAITSGLGYALWYSILPRLETTVAALAQLTVPVIALASSAVLLGEEVTLRLLLASLVILGGVALGVTGQRKIGSSGS